MNPKFEAAFKKYSGAIEKAVNQKASHDQRRALFFEFLHDGFGLSAEQVELEKGLYGLKVRGFIDALYQDLVVEFKKNFDAERETGIAEIKKYISGLKAYGQYFGILSDGVVFEIYLPLDGDLKLIETVKLTTLDTDQAFIWLDKYFFSAHPLKPTADDLVARFGPLSPVFIASMSDLSERFATIKDLQSVRVKIDEWGKLLSRVYGTAVGDEELFLRHTYLVVLSRLLVYLALFKRKPGQMDLDGLISGNAFRKRGLLNFAEEDFFAWLLESKILKQSKGWLWNLVQYFSVYEVASLTGDLLKELYQALVDPETRHNLGEFYTPDWLATLTLDKVDFKFPQSVLDPRLWIGNIPGCCD